MTSSTSTAPVIETGTSDQHLEITGAPKRLDHLPVVTSCLKTLRLAETIDERVKEHPQRGLSTGQCVEALILTILSGTHTLYKVEQTLEPFDLAAVLGPEFAKYELSDDRLGRALDCMFKAGLSALGASAVLGAIEAFDLDTSAAHFDTTSLSVHGQYRGFDVGNPENPDAAPAVTYGYSKAHRPDLKQVVFGLTVANDGYVPLFGRVTDGNRNDSLESRFNLTRLVEVLPDPRKTVQVGDSKMFSGETFTIANGHGVRLLCPLPSNTDAWADALEKAGDLETAPILREKAIVRGTSVDDEGHEYDRGDHGTDPKHVWRGRSVDVTHRWKEEVETEEGEKKKIEHKIPLRALVVWSSQLAKLKKRTLVRQREKERVALEKLDRKLRAREFHCQEDARSSALAAVGSLERFHGATVTVRSKTKTLKRTRRGRPKKGEKAPTKVVHYAEITYAFDQAKYDDLLKRAGSFTLVTQPKPSPAEAEDGEEVHDDRSLLALHKDQAGVEMGFKWAKGPAEVAPIFLETPSRIAALAQVYVFALMVYGLVQRRLRQRLEAKKTTIPGNRGRTSRPTGQVLFTLLANITAVPVCTPEGRAMTLIPEITTEQVAALKLLDVDLLDRDDVIAQVHEPRRGQRGYKAKTRKGGWKPGPRGKRRYRPRPGPETW